MFLKRSGFLIVLAVFFVFVNLGAQSTALTKINDAVNFLALGDWGRSGDFNQKEVAVQMNEAGKFLDINFVISTGDNFYENGVAGIDDPLWWISFENVYTGGSLVNPWYVVLGNHDYHGNAQAQIDYSKKSRRWVMPSRYYSIEKKIPKSNETILLLFLDTNQFEDSYYKNPVQYGDLIKQDPGKQIRWIDSVLTASTSKWKILVGHHHVYTGGSRKGRVYGTETILKPILAKHNIDVYLCGHEHDLQHIKPEGNTDYFVCGAGSELRETGTIPETKFSKSIQGFNAFSINKNEMLVQLIDYKGNLIYKYSRQK